LFGEIVRFYLLFFLAGKKSAIPSQKYGLKRNNQSVVIFEQR